MSVESIIARQEEIAIGNTAAIPLPKYRIYSVCNLRGGIGKTTLSFNLSYLADRLLAVDTCPQGNLSYFYDNNYYKTSQTNVNDMLLPYLIPGLDKAGQAASYIGATNKYFSNRDNYYIPSSMQLYLLPSKLITAVNQANSLPVAKRTQVLENILYSLKTEIEREMRENNLDKCLIDTSPFLAGATQLSWYAADALIIPVRTDQQSIESLSLLINILTNPQGEFRKYMPPEKTHTPRIQMVVLTHYGHTKIYLDRVYDILSKHRSLLSTDEPDNHIFLLDDFLGSGQISSYESKPIELLQAGQTKIVNRLKISVNKSIEKYKNQLRFISQQLW